LGTDSVCVDGEVGSHLGSHLNRRSRTEPDRSERLESRRAAGRTTLNGPGHRLGIRRSGRATRMPVRTGNQKESRGLTERASSALTWSAARQRIAYRSLSNWLLRSSPNPSRPPIGPPPCHSVLTTGSSHPLRSPIMDDPSNIRSIFLTSLAIGFLALVIASYQAITSAAYRPNHSGTLALVGVGFMVAAVALAIYEQSLRGKQPPAENSDSGMIAKRERLSRRRLGWGLAVPPATSQAEPSRPTPPDQDRP
jgi:hypothetical protein